MNRTSNLTILIAAAGMILLSTVSCQTPDILKVDPKAFPCGIGGKSCGNHKCCGEYEDCGGLHLGCPAEMCCYNGTDGHDTWGAKRNDGGTVSVRVTRQTDEVR